jgi:hypothetical protein
MSNKMQNVCQTKFCLTNSCASLLNVFANKNFLEVLVTSPSLCSLCPKYGWSAISLNRIFPEVAWKIRHVAMSDKCRTMWNQSCQYGNMEINITPNFTTMVTGHGNIRSYLHRFKILDTPTCPCSTEDQTVDHLLYECELLNKERDSLISTVLQTDVWPISKETLIRKHFKMFVKFTNEISFDKLNVVSNPLRQAS